MIKNLSLLYGIVLMVVCIILLVVSLTGTVLDPSLNTYWIATIVTFVFGSTMIVYGTPE